MSVSIYLACYITGRTGREVVEEMWRIKQIYERYGIEVISPIEGEDIAITDSVCGDRSDREADTIYKQKDKSKIKRANVFVYPGGKRSSQGIMDEYRLARGTIWKPTVGVFSEVRPGFITRRETDYVAGSHGEAALVIRARWGTWWKRLKWRLGMLNHSIPTFVLDQIKEFFR